MRFVIMVLLLVLLFNVCLVVFIGNDLSKLLKGIIDVVDNEFVEVSYEVFILILSCVC